MSGIVSQELEIAAFKGFLKVYLGRGNIDRLALINGSPVNYKSFGGVKISQWVFEFSYI